MKFKNAIYAIHYYRVRDSLVQDLLVGTVVSGIEICTKPNGCDKQLWLIDCEHFIYFVDTSKSTI